MAWLPFLCRVTFIFLSLYTLGNGSESKEVENLQSTLDVPSASETPSEVIFEKPSIKDAQTSPDEAQVPVVTEPVFEEALPQTVGPELALEVEPAAVDDEVETTQTQLNDVQVSDSVMAPSFKNTAEDSENVGLLDNASGVVVSPDSVDKDVGREADVIATESPERKEETQIPKDVSNITLKTEIKSDVIPSFLDTLFGANEESTLLKVPSTNVVTNADDGITVYRGKVFEGKICPTVISAPSGEISMPEPPLDPSCKAWSWTVTVGDGFYADVTVHSLDVNHKMNEFMIIGQGSSMSDIWDDNSNPVLTNKITSPKKFRILEAETFSVLLVANTPPAFTGNFKLSFERSGLVTTTPLPTTPASTLPTPAENVTSEIVVFVAGLTPEKFTLQRLEFQQVVAEMSNDYCKENHIELLEDSTASNVVLSLVTRCDITWPQSDICVQVNMSVAVITPDSGDPDKFELTAVHLQDMWDTKAKDHPGLLKLNLNVYEIPDAQSSLYLWLGVSLGVLLVFIVFLIAVWRIEILRDYSRMSGSRDSTAYSERSSMASNASWFPSSHQDVPPYMDVYAGEGYVEYEPEFDGPLPASKFRTSVAPPPPAYGPPPSYGPPIGFGGAVRFYGNTMRNNFDNPAFIEDDEGDDMTLDDEVNTDKTSIGNQKNNNENSTC